MKQSTFKISFCTDVERLPRSSPFFLIKRLFFSLDRTKIKEWISLPPPGWFYLYKYFIRKSKQCSSLFNPPIKCLVEEPQNKKNEKQRLNREMRPGVLTTLKTHFLMKGEVLCDFCG
jgi:hypothetical protein